MATCDGKDPTSSQHVLSSQELLFVNTQCRDD